MATKRIGFREAVSWLIEIVGPDAAYIRLGLVYTVAISLLALATPISVQFMINSVAFTAAPTSLWTLSGVLFFLLLVVATLSALRVYIMALFERRIFARTVAEITVRAVHAQNPFFADSKHGDLFNRYFDLAVIQKSVPSLVIGGFTIVLQCAVGLAITSFYHPFFLAFNAVLLLALLTVWVIWCRHWCPAAWNAGSFRTASMSIATRRSRVWWILTPICSRASQPSARRSRLRLPPFGKRRPSPTSTLAAPVSCSPKAWLRDVTMSRRRSRSPTQPPSSPSRAPSSIASMFSSIDNRRS